MRKRSRFGTGYHKIPPPQKRENAIDGLLFAVLRVVPLYLSV
jgi:hypothetical protein